MMNLPKGPGTWGIARGRSSAIAFSLLMGSLSLHASSFVVERDVTLQGKTPSEPGLPEWSGGALMAVASNRTPAPAIVLFDGDGRQLPALILRIPEAETVDVASFARGADGAVVACGNVYDRAGRGSGFLALFSRSGEDLGVTRLSPYSPRRVTLASDGSIWTTGMEVTNAKESTPPGSGVVRHFDRHGRLLGSFIPRSTFGTHLAVEYGRLGSAKGRIGWYTGPFMGPGSRFYEILFDGEVRAYPVIGVRPKEELTGLGLTDDGHTYVTMKDNAIPFSWRLLSTGDPGQAWVEEKLPSEVGRVFLLFGADGNHLVIHHRDWSTMAFLRVLPR